MQIQKTYDHLYQTSSTPTNAAVKPASPPSEAPAEPAPAPVTPAAPPTFDSLDESQPPMPETPAKKSVIPKLIILILIVLIGVLLYRLYPKDFADCQTLPGSNTENGVCTTFWRHQFSLPGTNLTIAPSNLTPNPTSAYLFPTGSVSPGPKLSPAPTASTSTVTHTTKGGITLEPTVVVPKSTPVPTAKPASTQPVPTTAPGDTSKPQDWVKHRYPDQKIAFWLPKGWTGSDAIYNRGTRETTFTLGGNNSLVVTLYPNWQQAGNPNSTGSNYQVKGSVPAYLATGSTYTTVCFEHAGQVYQMVCHNSLWSTCHTIYHNLELTP